MDKENVWEELDAHGKYTKSYIDILNTYKNQIENSVEKKNDLKTKFFDLIQGIMIALIVLFIVSIIISFVVFVVMIVKGYKSTAVITGAITTMLSTFATMMVSIFKLPKIIADYLFNKEEDNQMIQIIKNIQTYELEAVKLEKAAKLDSEKELIVGLKNDLPLEESPNVDGMQPKSMETTPDEEEIKCKKAL